MKKSVISIILLSTVAASQLIYANPNSQQVVAYECEQLDENYAEISCELDDTNRLRFHWNDVALDASEERRQEVLHAFNTVGMRYVWLSGKGFRVTASYWGEEEMKYCTPRNRDRTFLCVEANPQS